MKKIKILIVDDSKVILDMLNAIFSSDPQLEVVGMAKDPYEARSLVKKLNPDVLTLDIEMPRMNGLKFLQLLMQHRPMPVVMISTLTAKGADITLNALELGAVDYITKPNVRNNYSLEDLAPVIKRKIKMAAKANIQTKVVQSKQIKKSILGTGDTLPKKALSDFLILIGASTGGTEAIKNVITNLPIACPPVMVVLHIPPKFSESYAKRLNETTHFNVTEAKQGQVIIANNVYIAPGSDHLEIKKNGGMYTCVLSDKEFVNHHRPSVDVLFQSVNNCIKKRLIGVILTGMGDDGAKGMAHIKHNHNAFTIAQDEATSVVWGMPGSACKLNVIDKIAPVHNIADIIHQYMLQS